MRGMIITDKEGNRFYVKTIWTMKEGEAVSFKQIKRKLGKIRKVAGRLRK